MPSAYNKYPLARSIGVISARHGQGTWAVRLISAVRKYEAAPPPENVRPVSAWRGSIRRGKIVQQAHRSGSSGRCCLRPGDGLRRSGPAPHYVDVRGHALVAGPPAPAARKPPHIPGVIQAAPRIVRIGLHPDALAADVGVQGLLPHAEQRQRGAAIEPVVGIHIDDIYQD